METNPLGKTQKNSPPMIVRSLMNFRHGVDGRYDLTVPNSRKRFHRRVLAIEMFRTLTGLNDPIDLIKNGFYQRSYESSRNAT